MVPRPPLAIGLNVSSRGLAATATLIGHQACFSPTGAHTTNADAPCPKHAEAHPHSMGDIPPCATIYVNNLNEKTKKDGASPRFSPPTRTMWRRAGPAN